MKNIISVSADMNIGFIGDYWNRPIIDIWNNPYNLYTVKKS